MKQQERSSVGLIAGWGRYPIVIAAALRAQGRRVVIQGIRGHADPQLRGIASVYREIGLGQLGGAIRYFQRHDVQLATLAGKIHKVLLFERFYWLRHFPDWQCIRTFFPHFIANTKDRKDDTLLGAIVQTFAQQGIELAPATDFLPELLVNTGVLSKRRPSRSEWKDIAFGWQIAKELGRVDIGQTVAVKSRAVLAVEAIEGTDRCIDRAGELCASGGFVVVKVAKPHQDMRFDVPTIGIGTLESLLRAGARVLAIEAGKTIFIDEPKVLELADRHGIALVAVDQQALGRPAEAA